MVAVTGYWKLSQTLREIHEGVTQITATVSYNVLQGRRVEDILREMRESIFARRARAL